MEFHDGWAVLAMVIYIVGGLICWLIAVIMWEGPSRHPLRNMWLTGVILFILGVSAVNGVSWAASQSSDESRSATIGEVAERFGLTSGNEYPLELGSRISGSSGSGSISGNFFSLYGTATEQPASAISVSFTDGESSYILEVPTSKITFKKSDGPSTVQLFLNTGHAYSEATENPDAARNYTYGECKPVIVNFWFNCVKPHISVTTTLNAYVQRQGLSPIVAQYLESAVITLTPEAYKQLLG